MQLTVLTPEWARTAPHLSELYISMAEQGVSVRTSTLRAWALTPARTMPRCEVFHLNWLDHLAGRQQATQRAAWLMRLIGLLVLGRGRGRRVWWTVHNVEPHDRPNSRIFAVAMALTFTLANTVQFLSSSAEKAFFLKYPWLHRLRGKAIVTPLPAVSTESAIREQPDSHDRQPTSDHVATFLLFGILRRAKNVVETIRSFAAHSPDLHLRRLVVAGQAVDLNYEAAIIDAAANSGSVELRLWRHSDEDLASLLWSADWSVFFYERTSNSGALITSLGEGLPAIASDLPYFNEIAAVSAGAVLLTAPADLVTPEMWDRWAAQRGSESHLAARRQALATAERHRADVVATRMIERLVGPGPIRFRGIMISKWIRCRAQSLLDLASQLTFVSSARAQRFALTKSKGPEPELRLVMARCGDQAFVDVGANAGLYTAIALKSGARSVVAVEPLPELAARLRATFGRRIEVVVRALSSTTGMATLTVPAVQGVDRRTRATLDGGAKGRELTVPLGTLDDLGIEAGTMVKIDVEGHELEVLAGAEATLESQRVQTWLIEAEVRNNPSAVSDLIDLMGTHGYKGWAVLSDSLVPASHFDAEIHQSAADQTRIVGGGQRPPGYANNFCFVLQADEQTFIASARKAGFHLPTPD